MFKYSDFIVQYKSIVKFINENEDDNIVEFTLKAKKEFGDLTSAIAEWQKCRSKAANKLPLFFNANCIFTSRSYEQCTPELLSQYRFKDVKGEKALVIGGGLGVDDYFLSKNFKEVVSIDPDEELNEITRFNFTLLGATNIKRITVTAEDYLKNGDLNFDYVFIDPDRRSDNLRKSALEELKPDILKLWPSLLKLTQKIEVKVSPMIDSTFLLNAFKHTIDIKCISLKNEIKELLITKSKETKGNLIAVNIKLLGEVFEYRSIGEPIDKYNQESSLNQYLFIPFKSLYKLGIESQYASENSLKQIDRNCLFYTCREQKDQTIGGSWYKILLRPKKLSDIKKYIKTNKIKFINVSCLKSEYKEHEIFKYTGAKEGGDQFIFVCGRRAKPIILITEKTI